MSTEAILRSDVYRLLRRSVAGVRSELYRRPTPLIRAALEFESKHAQRATMIRALERELEKRQGVAA